MMAELCHTARDVASPNRRFFEYHFAVVWPYHYCGTARLQPDESRTACTTCLRFYEIWSGPHQGARALVIGARKRDISIVPPTPPTQSPCYHSEPLDCFPGCY